MKNEKKLVLELKELPQRAEKLDPEKIQGVFGGCGYDNHACFKSSDCCDGLKCEYMGFGNSGQCFYYY